jgi:anaphase-promoting complex subunit 2
LKELRGCLLAPPKTDPDEKKQEHVRLDWDLNVHFTIGILGFIDPYESILASVGYEYIEEHVLKTCTGEWAEPMLEDLRAWMSEKVVPWMVVPWMLHVYARRASNRMCHFLFVFI